jgi:ribose 5-phosphate isomerase A
MTPFADALAMEAVGPIRSGMLVGLGTGRAASRGINALAWRVNTERLKVTCVATSRASEELAAQLGLRLVEPSSVASVDYLFDGADEVDPQRRMIKGGGGAMTRERIVAQMCTGPRVYLIDEKKLSARLGVRAKLPIEVLPIARQVAAARLEALGLEGTYRVRPGQREEFITDNGALVLDVTLTDEASGPGGRGLAGLAAKIRAVPGVIDHGLFLDECQVLLVEGEGGKGIARHGAAGQ